jgi:hypothetical protein
MDGVKEHFFLEELRFLTNAAAGHASRIRKIAREWTEGHWVNLEVTVFGSR